MGTRLDVVEYAVWDTETTGGTSNAIRLVEIGIVRITSRGRKIGEYTTLVNPGRPLDPYATRGVGLCDRDLRNAPLFEEIAGDVVALMKGAVPVAHNASYDVRILTREFGLMGWDVPLRSECTRAIGYGLGLTERRNDSLSICCERQGVPLVGAHCALVDARATAELLACYLREARRLRQTLEDLGCERPAPAAAWPKIRPSGRAHRRTGIPAHVPPRPRPAVRVEEQREARPQTPGQPRRGRPPKPETVRSGAQRRRQLDRQLREPPPVAGRRALEHERRVLKEKLRGREHLLR
jgi:DNA polymerase III subunit epsilon